MKGGVIRQEPRLRKTIAREAKDDYRGQRTPRKEILHQGATALTFRIAEKGECSDKRQQVSKGYIKSKERQPKVADKGSETQQQKKKTRGHEQKHRVTDWACNVFAQESDAKNRRTSMLQTGKSKGTEHLYVATEKLTGDSPIPAVDRAVKHTKNQESGSGENQNRLTRHWVFNCFGDYRHKKAKESANSAGSEKLRRDF